MARLLAAAVLALGLLPACAPVPVAPAVHRRAPLPATVPTREGIAQPPDPRDAVPDRAWCLRTCRHLMRVHAAEASQPALSGADLDEALSSCTETCRQWASPARMRCLLVAESVDDVRACSY